MDSNEFYTISEKIKKSGKEIYIHEFCENGIEIKTYGTFVDLGKSEHMQIVNGQTSLFFHCKNIKSVKEFPGYFHISFHN